MENESRDNFEQSNNSKSNQNPMSIEQFHSVEINVEQNDSDENAPYYLISNIDQTKVKFRNKIKQLSSVVKEADDDSNEFAVDLKGEDLQFISKFLENHSYDMHSIQITTPLKSDILKDHLDSISYEMFKQYEGVDKADLLQSKIMASYYLDLVPFKKVCLLTLGCPFFIGVNDVDKEKYKEKWGIDALTPEEERKIIDENKPVFDKINNAFNEKMAQEEQKFKKEQEAQQGAQGVQQ